MKKMYSIGAVVFALIIFASCEKSDDSMNQSSENWKENASIIEKNVAIDKVEGDLYETTNGQKILEVSKVLNRAEGDGVEYTGTLTSNNSGRHQCPDSTKNRDCTNMSYKGEMVIVVDPTPGDVE